MSGMNWVKQTDRQVDGKNIIIISKEKRLVD